jgi:CubicO group peptidase (beta-lactamase class C family)
LWQDALETPFDTPFDLASLTKPIVTATVVMNLVSNRALALDEPIARAMGEWRGADRSGVTVRDLLEHASGLAARLVDAPPGSRREFEHEICTMQLEYMPRTQSIYSDLGFILLGFLAADRGQSTLDAQFAQLVEPIAPALVFTLSADDRRRAAPTMALDQDIRRGRELKGEVHDNYAAALGGVAGHAGLFGPAAAVGAFARAVLRAARGDSSSPPLTPAMVRLFTRPSSVPGSSRALGWDTMRPTSSCGTHMSSSAFGHVGFTGTSLWIDPDRDRYFVLLTNRAFTGASLDVMRDVRRAFHDALADL